MPGVYGSGAAQVTQVCRRARRALSDPDRTARTGTSRRPRAARATKRVDALDAVPEFEGSLEDGGVSGGHVDALGAALANVKPEYRDVFAADAARLLAVAERCTPEQFARFLTREIDRLDARAGDEKLARQRRNAGVRYWFDRDSGMWMLRGQFDPETGLELQGRLDNAVEALFHAAVPDDCPTGDTKQDFLRAAALTQLLRGRLDNAGESIDDAGRGVEVTVIIDLETLLHGLHEHTIIDTGSDAALPIESYRRMACSAAIIPAVLNGDGVILDQGREQRLANRVQRRALRTMYQTCAIPECVVRSRYCQPHHLHWWRHGGPTDLHNLLPLCSRHHHAVHEGGWKLTLHVDRSLTITFPNGTTQSTGPPGTQRAA